MIAVALSPKARALIRAHRSACLPTAVDRLRIEAALRAKLGSSVLPVEMPLVPASLPFGWQVRLAAALGLGLICCVLFLARQPAGVENLATPIPSALTANVASSATAVFPNEAPAAPHQLAEPPLPLPEPAPPSLARLAPPALDPLEQEVLLLSRATSQLRSGRIMESLATLDEHQRRFPNGAMSEERIEAKAQALCKLQRFREGRTELARLEVGSLTAARATLDCEAAPVARTGP